LKVILRRAAWRTFAAERELEAEVKSNGRLCKVSEFVQIETVDIKIRHLVNKAAILRTNAEVPRDIEVGASTVNERAASLPFRSAQDELARRIEDHGSASAQDIGPNVSDISGNVRDESAGYFVEIRL